MTRRRFIYMICSSAFVFAAQQVDINEEFGAEPKSNQVQVNGFCRVFQVLLFALHD